MVLNQFIFVGNAVCWTQLPLYCTICSLLFYNIIIINLCSLSPCVVFSRENKISKRNLNVTFIYIFYLGHIITFLLLLSICFWFWEIYCLKKAKLNISRPKWEQNLGMLLMINNMPSVHFTIQDNATLQQLNRE